jgi:hypothetical protein
MALITSTIVTVDASVTTAPGPSQIQQSGAIVSLGGTTVSTGAYEYFGTLEALQAALSSTGNYVEVGNQASTFFAQGNAVGVYVLELGVQETVPDGITALGTWITANPNIFYAYLVSATWDSSGSNLNTLAAGYSSPSGRTYFFVTTTSGTISAYAATTKAIQAYVPSPTAADTEFQAAAGFYQWLANDPGVASPAAPMAFRFVYGVTPWSLVNNQTTINAILTAGGNIILSGAEGGISTATIRNGTTMDGQQAMYWYAVDWILFEAKRLLAAAVINGSNSNPPLYYNQNGINSLLAILNNIGSDGIAFGLLYSATFSAVPFTTFVAQNPSDYAAGIYTGFSCVATWQAGFLAITFYLDATQFVA